MTDAKRNDDELRGALGAAREALAGADPKAAAGVLREIDLALARLHSGADPAAKKDLLAVICHDLKDPLASIVMGAGFLKRVLPEDEASASARRVALAILRSSERMNRVIGDFHDLGKLEAGRITLERRPQEIGLIVRAMADQLAATAKERGIDLAVDVQGGEALAMCDRSRVLQMLQKLTDNAFKFTPSGGTVTLCASTRDGQARLAVTDTGKGVPGPRKPTVFDREFNAGQVPRDGPGLGLAIVRELAILHGGRVGVEDNASGPGVTVWFTLPLA